MRWVAVRSRLTRLFSVRHIISLAGHWRTRRYAGRTGSLRLLRRAHQKHHGHGAHAVAPAAAGHPRRSISVLPSAAFQRGQVRLPLRSVGGGGAAQARLPISEVPGGVLHPVPLWAGLLRRPRALALARLRARHKGVLQSYAASGGPQSLEFTLWCHLKHMNTWPKLRAILARKGLLKGHMPCFCPKRMPIRHCHPEDCEGLKNLYADVLATKAELPPVDQREAA
jgi:hypothetical protein